MATGYILWHSKEKRVVAGPFTGATASADADLFMKRVQSHGEGRLGPYGSKDLGSSVITKESVTIN